MSERVVVHFTPGGKPVTHGGSGTAYANYGCRCEPCTAANLERVSRRRKERSPADITDDRMHGKRSTYVNWNCRCEPCVEAHAEACRREAKARKARAES